MQCDSLTRARVFIDFCFFIVYYLCLRHSKNSNRKFTKYLPYTTQYTLGVQLARKRIIKINHLKSFQTFSTSTLCIYLTRALSIKKKKKNVKSKLYELVE